MLVVNLQWNSVPKGEGGGGGRGSNTPTCFMLQKPNFKTPSQGVQLNIKMQYKWHELYTSTYNNKMCMSWVLKAVRKTVRPFMDNAFISVCVHRDKSLCSYWPPCMSIMKHNTIKHWTSVRVVFLKAGKHFHLSLKIFLDQLFLLRKPRKKNKTKMFLVWVKPHTFLMFCTHYIHVSISSNNTINLIGQFCMLFAYFKRCRNKGIRAMHFDSSHPRRMGWVGSGNRKEIHITCSTKN